jgi:hypothetical protein
MFKASGQLPAPNGLLDFFRIWIRGLMGLAAFDFAMARRSTARARFCRRVHPGRNGRRPRSAPRIHRTCQDRLHAV